MRASEALGATWDDLDEARCLLHLHDAKAGRRSVPLHPDALAVLAGLRARAGTPAPGDRILPVSYSAIKAAWYRACARAGVSGVRIHDLRHTAATRFTLEYHGNLPVLQVVTGHKTDSQLLRYVNVRPDDVVRLMHGRAMSEASAPAGLAAMPPRAGLALEGDPPAGLPANVIPIGRRRA